jgi:16S rRNA (uracil1498-N3)-methyltransferase
MPPRLYVDQALHHEQRFALPVGAARHVQVLRLQPGDALTLFNGQGGEWAATVEEMGRRDVDVRVLEHRDADRELALHVSLALGMPANDRMDDLIEKATELGVSAIQPLLCERSVLRLSGERADKRVAHWQGVAIAACEQSGRTRVPHIAAVLNVSEWLRALKSGGVECRLLLSLRQSCAVQAPGAKAGRVLCLSGPEGGLSEVEEEQALAVGFTPVSLGARVLRADTAPLAMMANLAHLAQIGAGSAAATHTRADTR